MDINESHLTYRPFAKVSQSQAERAFLVPSSQPQALIKEPGECYIPFDMYDKKASNDIKFISKSQLDMMKMTSLLKNTIIGSNTNE